MTNEVQSIDRGYGFGSVTEQRNKVLRNTYWLLALSLVPTVLGAWLGVAHVVGAGVRRIGSDVSGLAPEDRRDGAALFNLALGVFVATFAWWGFRGWFPDAVYSVVNGTFGWMSLLLPLLLHQLMHSRSKQQNLVL